jgi:precorrin-6Y C5,15-methyltransferase (decarboxylating)
MTGPPITVIGMDDRPMAPVALDRLVAATLIAGGARHLEAVQLPDAARRITLGNVSTALDALTTHQSAGASGVVLASGDPGFFGIVRLLRERAVPIEVFPAVSSIATLCARAGVSWDDAMVISAHGRGDAGLRRAVNTCRALQKVAILTAPGHGPAEIGAALEHYPRTLVIGEQLGTPNERVTSCRPQEAAARSWSEPNAVLVLGVPAGGKGWSSPTRQTPVGWALDESAFEHRDGMITKSEVRAVALSKLAPGVGDLVWDIGAGSGSVAIECARFGAAVDAVEVDPAQAERITHNAQRHGVEVHVVTGRAPEALTHLANPDAVFIGGGGADVTTIVEAAAKRGPRSIVVALAALERVGPVSQNLRDAGYETGGVQLSASRLATLPGDLTRLAATNPIVLIWGARALEKR